MMDLVIEHCLRLEKMMANVEGVVNNKVRLELREGGSPPSHGIEFFKH